MACLAHCGSPIENTASVSLIRKGGQGRKGTGSKGGNGAVGIGSLNHKGDLLPLQSGLVRNESQHRRMRHCCWIFKGHRIGVGGVCIKKVKEIFPGLASLSGLGKPYVLGLDALTIRTHHLFDLFLPAVRIRKLDIHKSRRYRCFQSIVFSGAIET